MGFKEERTEFRRVKFNFRTEYEELFFVDLHLLERNWGHRQWYMKDSSCGKWNLKFKNKTCERVHRKVRKMHMDRMWQAFSETWYFTAKCNVELPSALTIDFEISVKRGFESVQTMMKSRNDDRIQHPSFHYF